MVNEIRVYIEGGGDSRFGKDQLRKGFRIFLDDLYQEARQRGVRFHTPVLCGSRNSAFDDFRTALSSHPNAFNVLLVDAEAPVTATPWAHLKSRDGWDNPGVNDDCCHLMVQTMEAWFIADGDTLASYYGQGFLHSAIPANPNVENIAKTTIETALANSTRHTNKKKYTKIRDASCLLERIAPAVVRGKAPHCNRLFTVLQGKMA
jgi:hypothetical protein